MTPGEDRPAGDRLAAAIIALFAVAILLYLSGITWGVPYATAADRISAWGSDELAPLGPLAQIVHYVLHGDAQLDPRYPLLPYIVQGLFIAPYLAVLRLTGGLAGISTAYPYGLADPVGALATMTVLGRLPGLLMGAALPAIGFATAASLWDRRTARLAGLFVLVLYPLFFYSRTSNVDIHAVFWTALGLLVFARHLDGRFTTRRAAAFGLLAALATASKDQSYALFVPLFIVMLARAIRASPQVRHQRWRGLLIAVGAGAVAYSIASGLAFNPTAFFRHVSFITSGASVGSNFYYSTPATPAGYLSLLGEIVGHLAVAAGPLMLVAAAIGLVLVARREPDRLYLALPVLGLLVGVILPVRFVLLRFLIPAAFVLALFAARALALAAASAERVSPGARPARLAAAAAVVGSALWPLLRSLDLTIQMNRDSRIDAAAWIERNVQPGDTIGYYGSGAKLPAIPAGVVTMRGPWETSRDPDPAALPQFVLVIPVQPFEDEHEWSLPEDRYANLLNGEAGFRLVYEFQAPPVLFRSRPITWVNPPVRVFARRDVLARPGAPAPVGGSP